MADVYGHRDLGSAADFDRDWGEALSEGGGRWLIYPRAQPTTQFELFERLKAAQVDALLDKYGIKKGLLLEFGCGAAGMSIYLANKGFNATACDLSAKALQLARLNLDRNLSAVSSGSLSVVAANALHMPFLDETFDVVMSYGLLEHFEPRVLPSLVGEIRRTLRPGGLFVADIAHGRFSVRTVGLYLSLFGSLIVHSAQLRWDCLPSLWTSYTDALYENHLGQQQWLAILRDAGFQDPELRVLHPFPPLALSGRLETLYVAAMQKMRPAWSWFHRTQPPLVRGLGWLYLLSGLKVAQLNPAQRPVSPLPDACGMVG